MVEAEGRPKYGRWSWWRETGRPISSYRACGWQNVGVGSFGAVGDGERLGEEGTVGDSRFGVPSGELAGEGLDVVVVGFIFHDENGKSSVGHHTETDAVQPYKDCPRDLVSSHHFLASAKKTGLVHHTLKLNQMVSDQKARQSHSPFGGSFLSRAGQQDTL